MRYRELILDNVPELSGETVNQVLDLLYALTDALENQYFAQLRDTTDLYPPAQYDLFKADPETVEVFEPISDPQGKRTKLMRTSTGGRDSRHPTRL